MKASSPFLKTIWPIVPPVGEVLGGGGLCSLDLGALSKWPPGGVVGVPDAEPRETRRDTFDEQIRAGNPERQGGLAPLLEMVAARVAKEGGLG